jgi:hypothetical protein
MTLKNAVVWDVTYEERYQLLVTANAVSSSLILFTMVLEAICSSETSALNKSHAA